MSFDTNSVQGTEQIEAFVQECLNRNVSIEAALESVKEEWINQLEEQVLNLKQSMRQQRGGW